MVHHPEIDIPSYAGYLTVNDKYNSNLFFWFFPAEINPKIAPVVLWLQGGPGMSSLFGLFTEIGPYSISLQRKSVDRNISWHIHHNLIYIDNPVGTGFSFTESESGYANDEEDVGRDLLVALQQFFMMFPELQKNEFFVVGESYAGKYVPAVGYAILQDGFRKEPSQMKPKINLKGLAIGNGFTDPINQLNYGDYLYQLGLIDSNGHALFKEHENRCVDCIQRNDLECAAKIFDEILFDKERSLFKNLTGFDNFYNYLKTEDDENATPWIEFLQSIETRRAIHVGNNTFHDLYFENEVQKHLRPYMRSVATWMSELLSHYPVLVYNGQLDIICAYPLTENYLKALNFSGAEEYKTAKRCIWRVDNEIAGYVKQAGNLTEILVRNAGKSPDLISNLNA